MNTTRITPPVVARITRADFYDEFAWQNLGRARAFRTASRVATSHQASPALVRSLRDLMRDAAKAAVADARRAALRQARRIAA